MIVGQAGPQRLILPIMRMLGVQDITVGENPGDDRRVVLLLILIGPIDDVAGADIALRQFLGPMAHEQVMLRIRPSPGMTVDPRDIFPRPVRLYGRPEVVQESRSRISRMATPPFRLRPAYSNPRDTKFVQLFCMVSMSLSFQWSWAYWSSFSLS